ncbi:hypothetical protein V2O64_14530 [Verrucomicrobiaceae bacterium 227]
MIGTLNPAATNKATPAVTLPDPTAEPPAEIAPPLVAKANPTGAAFTISVERTVVKPATDNATPFFPNHSAIFSKAFLSRFFSAVSLRPVSLAMAGKVRPSKNLIKTNSLSEELRALSDSSKSTRRCGLLVCSTSIFFIAVSSRFILRAWARRICKTSRRVASCTHAKISGCFTNFPAFREICTRTFCTTSSATEASPDCR